MEARCLLSLTAVGPEFQVSPEYATGGYPIEYAAASNDAGHTVVAWVARQASTGSDIYVQRFDPAGVPQGDPQVVNAVLPADQKYPDVAMDAQGNFVVAWSTTSNYPQVGLVSARRFSANGAPLGDEFQVNSTAGSNQLAQVDMNDNGRFVVSWRSGTGTYAGSNEAFAQPYEADGSVVGSEILVAQSTQRSIGITPVKVDAEGGFAVAWSQYESGNNVVLFRRYDAEGSPLSTTQQINPPDAPPSGRNLLASDDQGRFLVAWSTSGGSVRGQRIDADGSPLGSSLDFGRMDAASLDMAGDGQATFTFRQIVNNRWTIVLRQFATDGTPLDNALVVNTSSTALVNSPQGVMASNGDVFVVWSMAPSAGKQRLLGQRFSENPGPSSLGDFVWHDLNGDGLQSPGEPGIAGVSVAIWNSTDGVIGNGNDRQVDVQTTDAEGGYRFDNLPPGTNYYLEFLPPDQFIATRKDLGGSDSLDSDVDPATGRTASFTVFFGYHHASYDAGFMQAPPVLQDGFRLGGQNRDAGYAIATDVEGNLYVGGEFGSFSDFDPGPRARNLPAEGILDGFVAKYRADGSLVWARRIGGGLPDSIRALAVDAAGNIYATGGFAGAVDFDQDAGIEQRTSVGGQDAFVIKFDGAGKLVWVRQLESSNNSNDQGNAIAVNADQQVYVAGYFDGSVHAETVNGPVDLVSAGSTDGFVAKLDAQGNFTWIRQFGGSQPDEATGAAVDQQGNVYTTGVFGGTVDFDPGAGFDSRTSLENLRSAFAWKLDAGGQLYWVHDLPDAVGAAVAVAGNEQVHFVGEFQGAADFDPGVETSLRTSSGDADAFVWSFSTTGEFAWAATYGAEQRDAATAVAVDAQGNVLATGVFARTVDFDAGPGNYLLSASGVRDAFVIRLDSMGQTHWAARMRSATTVTPYAIDVSADSAEMVLTGEFADSGDFDPGFGAVSLGSAVGADAFVVRLIENRRPGGVELSNTILPDNLRDGSPIGRIQFEDADQGLFHSFSLLNNAGGRFRLEDDRLIVNRQDLLETAELATHTIVVRLSDSGGQWIDRSFEITVLPSQEQPLLLRTDGPAFSVNSTTAGYQWIQSPTTRTVAMDAEGNFIVMWIDDGVDPAMRQLRAQRFDPSGTRLGEEITVTGPSEQGIFSASLVMDGAGNFMIVWAEDPIPASLGYHVLARRFDRWGVPRGDTFTIARYDNDNFASVYYPSVAMNTQGEAVVAWPEGRYTNTRLHAQRLDANAQPLGPPIMLEDMAGFHTDPIAVAINDLGQFAVAWTHYDEGAIEGRIMAQSFAVSGAPLTAAFGVTPVALRDERGLSIALGANGDLIIAGQARTADGNSDEAFVRRFSAVGQPLGAFVQFPATRFLYPGTAVETDPQGNFVVAWCSGTLWVQQFDADGNLHGPALSVVSGVNSRNIALDLQGNLVAVWHTATSQSDVFARRLVRDVAPVATSIPDLVMNEDGGAATINLRTYFNDDYDDSRLNFSVRHVSQPELFASVTVDPATGELTIVPAAGAHGRSILDIRATDARGLYVDATLQVNVVNEVLYVSAGPQREPRIRRVDAETREEEASLLAYSADYLGGVRVATGDINGDGWPDLVTAPGSGAGPHVRVFDGRTGEPYSSAIGSFYAYHPDFTGGVFVAAADVNRDGFADIVTGAGAGAGPHVRVFDGSDGSELMSFYAYDPGFAGGVTVAAADINGDGQADIITGAGAGGGPHVRVFSGADGAELLSFYAYDPNFSGGVFVAAGDLNADGSADVVTGAGAGGGPHVRAFSGADLAELHSFMAYDSRFSGGVRVATGDLNGDGRPDLITGAGPGGGPHVRGFHSVTGAELTSFFAFDAAYTEGVFVAGRSISAASLAPSQAGRASLAPAKMSIEQNDRVLEAAILSWDEPELATPITSKRHREDHSHTEGASNRLTGLESIASNAEAAAAISLLVESELDWLGASLTLPPTDTEQ